eukprot:Pgem_evm1s176
MFFGHSQGAAVATLQAAYFVHKGYEVHGLVTHGSPRVGDSGLTNFLMNKVAFLKRYVALFRGSLVLDVFVQIPPANVMVGGYPTFIPTNRCHMMSVHMQTLRLLDFYRADEDLDALLNYEVDRTSNTYAILERSVSVLSLNEEPDDFAVPGLFDEGE